MFLVQAALPHLERSEHAAVVNVISAGAFLASANGAMYAAAKAALMSFTRAMGSDFAAQGIRVNALAPGHGRHRHGAQQPARGPAADGRRLADEAHGRPRRDGRPGLLLASDAGSFITGQCILADGGLVPH